MTDEAVKTRPEVTIHAPRAGQRAGNGEPHKEHRHQGSAGAWTPSRACHSPLRKKASLATLFGWLAKAAAANDGEVPKGTFGESA
jgi:hypothetical protein